MFGVDIDDLVLGPVMDTFACPAVLTPIKSRPGEPPYAVRGVFSFRPDDITEGDVVTRADAYTFGVRLSEFAVSVARGDIISEIDNPLYASLLADRMFTIEDTGDDGPGHQSWVLKEYRPAANGWPDDFDMPDDA